MILPGFPTSAIFTFHEFVAPAIRAFAGVPAEQAERLPATLPMRIASERGRTEYLMVPLVRGDGYSSLAFIVAIGVALPVLGEELPIRPDDTLTPGVVGSADFADVCGLVDGQTYSQRHRDTTQNMKKAAYATYDVNKAGREFEVDHRIPLCIGGADHQANLWPQLGFEHPSFHDKDRLETRVCRAVCRTGTMTLAEGQAIFLGDWIAGFERVFGEPPQ